MLEVTESLELGVGAVGEFGYRVTGSLPTKDAVLSLRPIGEHEGIVLRAADPDTAALGFSCASNDDRERGHCALAIPLEPRERGVVTVHTALPGRYELRGSLKRWYPSAEERLRDDETECTTYTEITVLDRAHDAGPDGGAE